MMVEYSLIEQEVGYAVYLDAGDSRWIDQNSTPQSDVLATLIKRAAWFDSVFLESSSGQAKEVVIDLLRTVKGSEQSYQMLFVSEFPNKADKEPFRIVGFDVAPDNSMGIATSGMSGAIGYFPLHEQQGVWEYLTDENLDRDSVFVLCEMGLEWATLP